MAIFSLDGPVASYSRFRHNDVAATKSSTFIVGLQMLCKITNFAFALIMAILPAGSAIGFPLITAEEAKLPPGGLTVGAKALIPGPIVSILFPRQDAASTSPIVFFVTFKPYARTSVNLDSLRITYVKQPPIDLTVRNFIKLNEQGFRIENAEVPPGTHTIRIDIEDQDGRPGSQHVVFTTLP